MSFHFINMIVSNTYIFCHDRLVGVFILISFGMYSFSVTGFLKFWVRKSSFLTGMEFCWIFLCTFLVFRIQFFLLIELNSLRPISLLLDSVRLRTASQYLCRPAGVSLARLYNPQNNIMIQTVPRCEAFRYYNDSILMVE
jgi:hypothetical protein